MTRFAFSLPVRHGYGRFLSTTLSRRKDPWPLPHTPEHLASTATPVDLAPPEPLPRPGETIDALRARLVYQSRKRGTLESDLLLSTFAKDELKTMNEAELKEFDRVRFAIFRLIFFFQSERFLSCSSWMNLTGIFTIGRRRSGRPRSDGQIRHC
jgi:succinate dehydrogenase assembly factor 2